MNRQDILLYTQCLDWDEVVEDFQGLTHQEIYECLRLMGIHADTAERLASTIIQEFNRSSIDA